MRRRRACVFCAAGHRSQSPSLDTHQYISPQGARWQGNGWAGLSTILMSAGGPRGILCSRVLLHLPPASRVRSLAGHERLKVLLVPPRLLASDDNEVTDLLPQQSDVLLRGQAVGRRSGKDVVEQVWHGRNHLLPEGRSSWCRRHDVPS